MEARGPFNPADPFDASAEMIRRAVVQVVMDADRAAIFRDLPDERKVQCLMAGLMTGAVGCLFCFIRPECHEEFLKELAAWLPSIQEQVDSIMADGRGRVR